jgi:hypothetical protein
MAEYSEQLVLPNNCILVRSRIGMIRWVDLPPLPPAEQGSIKSLEVVIDGESKFFDKREGGTIWNWFMAEPTVSPVENPTFKKAVALVQDLLNRVGKY